EGPEGTQDVGECRTGTAECVADGQLASCESQILPGIELCITEPALDEDCNGAANDRCANWAREYGTSGQQGIEAMNVTATGDVLVTGRNNGSIDLGGATLTTSSSNARAFVARLDTSRMRCPDAHCWSVGFGGTGKSTTNGIVESTAGDALLVGSFTSRLDIGTVQAPSGSSTLSMFVTKLDGDNGVSQWIRHYGTDANDEELIDVAPRPNGGVATAGFTTGTIDFQTPQGSISAMGEDALVLTLDAAGVAQWAHGYGGAGDDRAVRVIADADGTLYVTGWFAEEIDFGCSSGALTTAEGPDAFVAKLDAAGQCVWSIALGGPDEQRGQALARIDDRVLVGVNFAGTISDADAVMLETAEDVDVLIAELDVADGKLVTHHFFPAAGEQELWDLAPGPNGIVAAALSLRGSIDFGGGPLLVPTYDVDIDDAAILVLEADGRHRFSRSFGGVRGDDDAFSVAFDAEGRLFAAGEFDGSLDVGTGAMFSQSVDAYLLRIDDP
ncbi:MAG TPA: hypothetical protein VFB62_09430, partial [Polyangiaceae bacterium]|nr:hypothetical protein [Polyangiaceae bacterium]